MADTNFEIFEQIFGFLEANFEVVEQINFEQSLNG